MELAFEPWHAPLLAMTVVLLPPAVGWALNSLRVRGEPPDHRGVEPPQAPAAVRARWELRRTQVLAVLTVVLLIVFFVAIGPAAASIVATAATAASTAVSAALTVQSFLKVQDIRNQAPQPNDSATSQDQERHSQGGPPADSTVPRGSDQSGESPATRDDTDDSESGPR